MATQTAGWAFVRPASRAGGVGGAKAQGGGARLMGAGGLGPMPAFAKGAVAPTPATAAYSVCWLTQVSVVWQMSKPEPIGVGEQPS